MSYDISLFDRAFLKRAIETSLGDWTGADAIADEVKDLLISRAVAQGFGPVPTNEELAAFVREQGAEPGREFEIDTPSFLAQLAVYPGQIAFTIPYSARAAASIELCARIARELAAKHGLGYHDPQEGVANF